MIFRKSTSCIVSMNFDRFTDFKISQADKEEAMKRDYKNPLLVWDDSLVKALYCYEGKLYLQIFGSYYGFKEGIGEHGLDKQGDNYTKCKCGEIFLDKKKKKGIDYFNEHLTEIKKIIDGANE